MDIKEKSLMTAEQERSHWWIATRFQYINLAASFLKTSKIKLLEFGCGTGQNLWFARLASSFKDRISSSLGIDPELPSDFKADWQASEHEFSKDLDAAPANNQLILAMDVLEHIEDDKAALTSWVSKLDQDGVLLITVPAFKALWSYHDEYLGHYRRYTTEQLRECAEQAGLEVVYLKYAFGFLYFPVYIIRRLMSGKKESSDLAPPNPVINFIMKVLGKIEFAMGGNPLVGTSVVGVFKVGKPKV